MRDQVDPFRPLVGRIEIERRRHDLVANGKNAEDALDRPRAAQQMPDGRLGAAHRCAAQIVAEDAPGRCQLDRVGHGRGAVGVDIVDVAWGQPGLAERHAHRIFGAHPVGVRSGDVIGVARQAVSDHLGINGRAARLGMLIFLQHDNARALAHDEAVAVPVIGAAGLLGPVVIAHVQGAGLGETGNPDRADGRLGAARDHDVGIVVANHPRRIPDRVRPRGAGRDHRVIGAHQAVFDRDLARDEVDQPSVDEVRADPPRPLVAQHQALALDARQAADPAADRAAGAQLHFLRHVREPRILERLPRRVESEDDERIDLALDLVVDPFARIEAIFVIRRLDLAGDAALLVGGVEVRDRPRAALAGQDVAPARLDIAAQRRHQTQPRDHYAPHVLPLVNAKQARDNAKQAGLTRNRPGDAEPVRSLQAVRPQP